MHHLSVKITLLVLLSIATATTRPISVSFTVGSGYQWINPNELNHSFELLSKRVNEINALSDTFSFAHFNPTPRWSLGVTALLEYILLKIELNYMYLGFTKKNLLISYNSEAQFSSQSCTENITLITESSAFDGCINTQQEFHFFPLWASVAYPLEITQDLRLTFGGGTGVLIGSNTFTIDEYRAHSTLPANHSKLTFSLRPDFTPLYKAELALHYHFHDHVGISMTSGYQWITLHNFVAHSIDGESETLSLALGHTLSNNQTLSTRHYPGLGSEHDSFAFSDNSDANTTAVTGNFSSWYIDFTLVFTL